MYQLNKHNTQNGCIIHETAYLSDSNFGNHHYLFESCSVDLVFLSDALKVISLNGSKVPPTKCNEEEAEHQKRKQTFRG